MAINLLEQLMNKAQVPSQDVEDAQNALEAQPIVTLEGVNAPEFEESVPFDMEDAYAAQPAPIKIPVHNDGLDDEEEALTSEHVDFGSEEEERDCDLTEVLTVEDTDTQKAADLEEAADDDTTQEETVVDVNEGYGEDVELGEDGEPVLWNLKPFTSRYFNFGGRTTNSLARGGFKCFDDIRGMAYSELKALKGFGQGCLDEVLDLLEAENQSDWLLKRKKKVVQATSTSDEPIVESAPAVDVAPEAVETETAVEVAPEADSAAAVNSPSHSLSPLLSEDTPASADSGTSSEDEAPVPVEAAPQVVSPKILTIGGSASLSRPGLNIASFEMVYADVIRTICQQSSAPSISSIEYGKGWGALATTIRMNGWPQGIDVLTISKSFMGRSEIVMELRLLADLVLEA